MKIGIIGTGVVGRAHAARLSELGHEVLIGTNNVEKTIMETKSDRMGNPPFSAWNKEHNRVKLATFTEAARQGEIIFEALHGEATIEVLKKI